MEDTKVVIVMAGLPRSGKSTWALKQGYPIVCRDSIRLALHGQAYIPEAEEMITVLETQMVKALFFAGHATVIVDSTHITAKLRSRWDSPLWDTQLQIMKTSKDKCMRRAEVTNPNLIPVIEWMVSQTDLDLDT